MTNMNQTDWSSDMNFIESIDHFLIKSKGPVHETEPVSGTILGRIDRQWIVLEKPILLFC